MLSFIDQGTFFQIILCAFCKLTYISSEAPLYNRRFINPFSLLRKSGYKYTFQLSVPRLHGSSGPQELPSVSVNRDRVWLGHALPWLNILRNIRGAWMCVCAFEIGKSHWTLLLAFDFSTIFSPQFWVNARNDQAQRKCLWVYLSQTEGSCSGARSLMLWRMTLL